MSVEIALMKVLKQYRTLQGALAMYHLVGQCKQDTTLWHEVHVNAKHSNFDAEPATDGMSLYLNCSAG